MGLTPLKASRVGPVHEGPMLRGSGVEADGRRFSRSACADVAAELLRSCSRGGLLAGAWPLAQGDGRDPRRGPGNGLGLEAPPAVAAGGGALARACREATRGEAAAPPVRVGRGDDRGARAAAADHGERHQAGADERRPQGRARLAHAPEGLSARPGGRLGGRAGAARSRQAGAGRGPHASYRALTGELIPLPVAEGRKNAGASRPSEMRSARRARPRLSGAGPLFIRVGIPLLTSWSYKKQGYSV